MPVASSPSAAWPGRRLPERLAAAEREGGVFGRGREVEAILAGLRAAEPGAPAVAVVQGEAGIGKTRLAAEAASQALAAGAGVLYGRSEQESVVPYQPFAEALGQLAADLPADAAAGLGGEVAEAARLAPALRERLHEAGIEPGAPPDDVGEQRYRLFGAVRALLSAAAGTAPLLVVLDDLHWADASSLR
ncbi:MAG TPA: ATP-binding protein, partial [Solirubrobacteraceae bacterium]